MEQLLDDSVAEPRSCMLLLDAQEVLALALTMPGVGAVPPATRDESETRRRIIMDIRLRNDQSEAEARRVIEAYFPLFNNRDASGLLDVVNFPHIRIAQARQRRV